MNSSALCSMMLTLCLILISYSPLPTNARVLHGHHGLLGNNPGLIDQICNQTSENKIECINILREDPKISQAKNFFDFSKAVLELALKKGREGQNFLKGLAQKIKDPAIAECANNSYNEVVGSFWSALGELKESPDTANYDAKVAGDGSANCETGLAAAHIVNPSISALNHKISLLSFIAYLATSNL